MLAALLPARLDFIDNVIQVIHLSEPFEQRTAVNRYGTVLRCIVTVIATQRKNVPIKNQPNHSRHHDRLADCPSCRR